MIFRLPPLFAGVFCLISMNAGAATLFDSISQPGGLYLDNEPTVRVASDFRTGSQSSTITGILAVVSNPDTTDKTFQASIYNDAGGTVGSLVAAFSPTGLLAESTGDQQLLFSHGGLSLAADTSYWLVLETLETEWTTAAVQWSATDAGAEVGFPFQDIGSTSMLRSDSFDTNWTPFVDGLATDLRYSVIGTLDAVPEPSRVMLFGLGLLSMLMRRNRNQK